MPATETIADAEALFERGPVRYFEGEKTVKVDLNDLAGDTEYNLYVAVRNINPLVYSDLASKVIDTHVPYTEMITLESVGLTSFSYHIMKPEGVTKYKHVCLSKSDYDYIVSLIGGSLHSYVSAFGAEATEDQTYNFDTTFFDIVDFRQDIAGGEHFLRHGLQKLLLGLHPAQILAAVAGTVVIVTEADHPQGVRAVEVLHSLLEVDAEVLDGVIVVHVDGDLKINAADSDLALADNVRYLVN